MVCILVVDGTVVLVGPVSTPIGPPPTQFDFCLAGSVPEITALFHGANKNRGHADKSSKCTWWVA